MKSSLSPAQRMQGWLAWGLFAGLGALPFSAASALGGLFARAIGPRLSVTDRARRNLALAFPELGPTEIERIVRAMWDNLGRTVAEFPHLPTLDIAKDPRIRREGFETIDRLVGEGRQLIFISAHIGNWELSHLSGTQHGLDVLFVNRAANNPAIETLIQAHRVSRTVPKGAGGARLLLKQLRRGGHLGFLLDQKMNDGIAAPFFGHPAMTASAPAEMALRHGALLVPVRVTRFDGPRFEIRVYSPIETDPTQGHHAAVLHATTAINEVIEAWVRETPGQWFWLHRRWPTAEIDPL